MPPSPPGTYLAANGGIKNPVFQHPPSSSRFALAAIRAKARLPNSYIAQTGTASTFSASRYGSLAWQMTWPNPTS